MAANRFDAVIFDLDGTLCDSEPFIAAAGAEALRRRYGITVPTDAFAPFVGAGDDRFITGTAALYGITADLAVDKALMYEVYLEQIPGALQPVAGAFAFIDALRAAGVRVALATGGDLPKVLANLAAIGLRADVFETMVTAEAVVRRKPHPETFEVAVARLGLDPSRCLVVEDARNGVLAGVGAGCEVLGIASSQPAQTLLEAGARVAARDYTQLPADLLAELGIADAAPAPRTVVFDLGGVLIDWNPRAVFRQYLADDAEVESLLDEIDFHGWNASLDAGGSWADAVEDLATRHPERRALIEAFHRRWPESLVGEIDGTKAVLAELRGTGVRLLALSNWSAETFPVAREQFELLGWFEGILISGDAGVAKPDRRIFEHFTASFGVDATTAVYIDDSAANVAMAADLGFRALRFTSPEALRDDLARLGLPVGRELAPPDA